MKSKTAASETIPAATVPVEEIAAHVGTTPRKLRGALARAAVAGYVIDLGHGLRMKVEIVEEANLSADSDDELTELARLGCLAAPKPASALDEAVATLAARSVVRKSGRREGESLDAYWTRTAKAAPKYPRMTSKDEGDYAWRN
jgi:hypothetical protein